MPIFLGFAMARCKRKILYFTLILIIFAGFFSGSGELCGDEISSRISSGEIINLNNKKINGDIVITNARICQPLKITNSEINGNVVLDGSIFNNDVSFENTTIVGQSSFINSTFFRETNFTRSDFLDRANFQDANFAQCRFDSAEFLGDAILSNCEFDGKPIFLCAKFYKDAIFRQSKFFKSNFENAEFHGIAFFKDAMFKDETSFNYAIMSAKADFSNAFFYKEAQFNGLTASNEVDFSNAMFAMMVDFRDSRFGGYSDFFNTTFQRGADFSDLKASNEVDFSKSNFSKMADFHDARFSGYANFKNASFQNLSLSGALFNQFYLPWKNVKGNLDCDEYLYLRMISTYKDLGLFDDSDDCYYYFKANYRQEYLFSNFIEPILGELYGWGVKPINTIKWSIIFILIFGLFFWFPYILTDTHLVKGRSDLSATKPSECSPNGTVQSIGEESIDLQAASFFNAAGSTFLSLILSLIFSARIFASALTSTIEGPSLNGPGSNIAKLEKLLAHLMAFLLLIAISKTILREII